MNTWVLAKDLPVIAERGLEPAAREVARTVHGNYTYPVDSQVLSCTGELLDHVGANEDPGTAGYLKLLDAAAVPEKRE